MPGSAQGQAGQALEQPGIGEGVPAQGRGGRKWAVRSMAMLLLLSLSNLVFSSAEISLSPQGRVIFCLFHLYHQFLFTIPTQWG